MKMKAVDQKDSSYLRGLLLCERLAAKPPKKKLMKKHTPSKSNHRIFVPETLGNAKTKTTMVRAKPGRRAFCDDLAVKTVQISCRDSEDLAATETRISAVAAAMEPPGPPPSQQMMSTPPSSPKTAARVTMLKKKFAGTILKAQRQLFANGAAKLPAIEERRRAAREALEKVERSIEVENSHKSFKDLEQLCGFPIPYNGGFLETMHDYGLYLKN